MSQAHGLSLWKESAGAGAVPTVREGVLVEVSPGIYEFALNGTPAASLVDDGSGGYDISNTDLTGTGGIVLLGAGSQGVIY